MEESIGLNSKEANGKRGKQETLHHEDNSRDAIITTINYTSPYSRYSHKFCGVFPFPELQRNKNRNKRLCSRHRVNFSKGKAYIL